MCRLCVSENLILRRLFVISPRASVLKRAGATYRGIRADALSTLEAYDWPGNIRQLENTIFRAVVLCDGEELTLKRVPADCQRSWQERRDAPTTPSCH